MLTGALLGLSFPPFPFPFLAWIAFVPLLVVWDDDRTDGRSAFLEAYIALLVTFAIAFQWPLFHSLTETAMLSLPPLLILPMWMALPFAVSRPVFRRLGFGPGTAAFIAFYVLMEWGLRAGPFAFPWPLVGHSQAEWFPVNQLAALGGVPLITMAVLAANGIVAAIFRGVRFPPRLAFGGVLKLMVAAAAAAAAVAVAVAAAAAADPDPDPPTTPQRIAEGNSGLRIAGIQPSLSPQSWADLDDSTRVSGLLAVSRAAVSMWSSPPDLIVWPETSIPPYPSTSFYTERLQALVDSLRIPILAGAITNAPDDGSAYRNSALLVVPDGAIRSYDKINLVPFAERVPFAGVIPKLERFAIPAGGISGYEPGENRAIFDLSGRRFGVLICLETLFSEAAREYAHEGVGAIIAITQDGWWGDSFGYRQHLAFNRLRSIETGLPMLQASVSGVSAVIDSVGRVRELAGWMEPTTWMVIMPPAGQAPPYLRWGEWVTMLAAVGGLVFAAATFARAVRSNGANDSL